MLPQKTISLIKLSDFKSFQKNSQSSELLLNKQNLNVYMNKSEYHDKLNKMIRIVSSFGRNNLNEIEYDFNVQSEKNFSVLKNQQNLIHNSTSNARGAECNSTGPFNIGVCPNNSLSVDNQNSKNDTPSNNHFEYSFQKILSSKFNSLNDK